MQVYANNRLKSHSKWLFAVIFLGLLVTGCRQRVVSDSLPASRSAGNEGDLQDQAEREYLGVFSRKFSLAGETNDAVFFVLKLDDSEEVELLTSDPKLMGFLETCIKEGRRVRVAAIVDPSYNAKKFPPTRPDLIILSAEVL